MTHKIKPCPQHCHSEQIEVTRLHRYDSRRQGRGRNGGLCRSSDCGRTDTDEGAKETGETVVSEDDGNTTEENGRLEFCPGNVRTGSWYPAIAHSS
jgi:hypothetical protein